MRRDDLKRKLKEISDALGAEFRASGDKINGLRAAVTGSYSSLERAVHVVSDLMRLDDKTPLKNEMALTDDGNGKYMKDPSGWAVLSGDVDDFKDLNKRLGYDTADLVLHSVGTHLAATISNIDGEAYRRHGDEFVLVVPASAVRKLCEAVVKQYSPLTILLPGCSCDVTMSFGLAFAFDGNETWLQWIERADLAALAAKAVVGTSVTEWAKTLDTGYQQRSRCPECRSQLSISVPPGVVVPTQLSCPICGNMRDTGLTGSMTSSTAQYDSSRDSSGPLSSPE